MHSCEILHFTSIFVVVIIVVTLVVMEVVVTFIIVITQEPFQEHQKKFQSSKLKTVEASVFVVAVVIFVVTLCCCCCYHCCYSSCHYWYCHFYHCHHSGTFPGNPPKKMQPSKLKTLILILPKERKVRNQQQAEVDRSYMSGKQGQVAMLRATQSLVGSLLQQAGQRPRRILQSHRNSKSFEKINLVLYIQ